MGRKVNLAYLRPDECEKILSVVQKDLDLREKETQRLRVISRDVSQKQAETSVLSKKGHFNEKHCIRCCATFSFFFWKKQLCVECKYFVCKECASWDKLCSVWVCNVCEKQRDLTLAACDWFYFNVRQKFRNFGSSKVIRSLYKYGNTGKTRPAIEANETSDSHREQLSEEEIEVWEHIEQLVENTIGEGLRYSQTSKMFNHADYDVVDGVSTPMERHAMVKELLQQMMKDVDRLPLMKDGEIIDEDKEELAQAYEDVLASAIINKIVYDHQCRVANSMHENIEGEQQLNKCLEICWPLGDADASGLNSEGGFVSSPIDGGMVLALDSDEEVDAHWEGLDHLQYHTVKLPEILCSDTEEAGGDNWYFKNEDILQAYNRLSESKIAIPLDESVFMTTPYERDAIKPKIGESYRDVDELSELSEESLTIFDMDHKVDVKSVREFRENNLVNYGRYGQEMTMRKDLQLELDPAYSGYDDYFMDVPYRKAEFEALRAELSERDKLTSLDTSLDTHLSEADRLESSTMRSDDSKRLSISSSVFDESLLEDASFTRKPHTDPSFRLKPKDCIIKAGDPVRFRSRPKGTKPIDVFWYKDTTELTGERYHAYYDEGVHYLEIYDTSLDDAGEYLCVAVNEVGECSTYFTLNVKESGEQDRPPFFKVKIRNQKVTEGGPAEFMCIIDGFPIPSLTFFRNGRRIANSDRYSIESLGGGEWTLVIHPTTIIDNAEFKAVVKNKLGSADCSATLTVVSKGRRSASLMDLSSKLYDMENKMLRSTESLLSLSSDKGDSPRAPPRRKKKPISVSDIPVCEELQNYYDELKAAKQQEPLQQSALKDFYTKADAVTIDSPKKAKHLHLPPGKLKPASKAEPVSKPPQLSPIERLRPKVDMSKIRPPLRSRTADDEQIPYQEFEKQFYGGESNIPKPIVGAGLRHVFDDDDHVLIQPEGDSRIDCGLKIIDPDQYKRDFYVSKVPQTDQDRAKSPRNKQVESSVKVKGQVAEEVPYIPVASVTPPAGATVTLSPQISPQVQRITLSPQIKRKPNAGKVVVSPLISPVRKPPPDNITVTAPVSKVHKPPPAEVTVSAPSSKKPDLPSDDVIVSAPLTKKHESVPSDVTISAPVAKEAEVPPPNVTVSAPVSKKREPVQSDITISAPVSKKREPAQSDITVSAPVSKKREPAQSDITVSAPLSKKREPARSDVTVSVPVSKKHEPAAEGVTIMAPVIKKPQQPEVTVSAPLKQPREHAVLTNGTIGQESINVQTPFKDKKRREKSAESPMNQPEPGITVNTVVKDKLPPNQFDVTAVSPPPSDTDFKVKLAQKKKNDELSNLPSVKQLKSKFTEQDQPVQKLHSITARDLSRGNFERLRHQRSPKSPDQPAGVTVHASNLQQMQGNDLMFSAPNLAHSTPVKKESSKSYKFVKTNRFYQDDKDKTASQPDLSSVGLYVSNKDSNLIGNNSFYYMANDLSPPVTAPYRSGQVNLNTSSPTLYVTPTDQVKSPSAKVQNQPFVSPNLLNDIPIMTASTPGLTPTSPNRREVKRTFSSSHKTETKTSSSKHGEPSLPAPRMPDLVHDVREPHEPGNLLNSRKKFDREDDLPRALLDKPTTSIKTTKTEIHRSPDGKRKTEKVTKVTRTTTTTTKTVKKLLNDKGEAVDADEPVADRAKTTQDTSRAKTTQDASRAKTMHDAPPKENVSNNVEPPPDYNIRELARTPSPDYETKNLKSPDIDYPGTEHFWDRQGSTNLYAEPQFRPISPEHFETMQEPSRSKVHRSQSAREPRHVRPEKMRLRESFASAANHPRVNQLKAASFQDVAHSKNQHLSRSHSDEVDRSRPRLGTNDISTIKENYEMGNESAPFGQGNHVAASNPNVNRSDYHNTSPHTNSIYSNLSSSQPDLSNVHSVRRSREEPLHLQRVKKRKQPSAVLARASFWDQRVEEKKVSDQDAGLEYYPRMDTMN